MEEAPDGSLWMLEDANPRALIHDPVTRRGEAKSAGHFCCSVATKSPTAAPARHLDTAKLVSWKTGGEQSHLFLRKMRDGA